jgi:uncharacterized YkwD family protein/spore coat assembly protein SafA
MAQYRKTLVVLEMMAMRRLLTMLFTVLAVAFAFPDVSFAQAASTQIYIVRPGDSLWKICVRYQVGLSELIRANPQIKNPHLIYPGQRVVVPLNTGIVAVENQVIQLVNQERLKRGLPALVRNWELCRVARIKSQDMRDRRYFSHTSPTYGDPFRMMRAFGIHFTAAGENIAAGQPTPAEVMRSWMNSTGHRSNILNRGYTQIGVGFARGGPYGYYWTQDFIHP